MDDDMARRLKAATHALKAHKTVSGDNKDDKDDLVDLLTDLRHWAVSKNIGWSKALATADNHWREEADDATRNRFGMRPLRAVKEKQS